MSKSDPITKEEITSILDTAAIGSPITYADAQRLKQHIQYLTTAVQSHHDYGPASPGEQEAAWQQYCAGTGWDPNAHTSAKNAFCEGFCYGDLFSDGDEWREVLRAEVKALEQANREAAKRIADLEKELEKHGELEASLCPEDVGFAEHLKACHEEMARRQQKLAVLDAEIARLKSDR